MYTFSTEEKKTVEFWNSNQKDIINIKFIKAGLKEDKSIENFLDILVHAAPAVKVKKEDKKENVLPEIRVTENIKYSAVPLANELKPFLKALSIAGKVEEPRLSKKVQENLDKVNIPVSLKLFAAQACPHCPVMVNDMLEIAGASENIDLNIIDPTIFTKIGEENAVMSVPCLILDSDFRWTGSASLEEVTDVLANRDPATLKAPGLRRILEDGKASWLTEQMVNKNLIFPEFIKLVLHEIWSVRLGAMVVIEELAEVKPDLANTICPLLWEKFPDAPDDVKGDILYAVGETGGRQDLELVEKELNDIEGEDLAEAARDAADSIKSRL